MFASIAKESAIQATRESAVARSRRTSVAARGEPYLWTLGGALAFGVLMIAGFLALVVWNGIATFYPKPLELVTTAGGETVAGEAFRSENYRPGAEQLARLSPEARRAVDASGGLASRTLYRVGNFDIYNDDFRWVSNFEVAKREFPAGLLFIERLEWGPFVGKVASVILAGKESAFGDLAPRAFVEALDAATHRREQIRTIERHELGAINHHLERERLRVRRVALDAGEGSEAHLQAQRALAARAAELKGRYDTLAAEAAALRADDAKYQATLVEIGGKEKTIPLSGVVRLYAANDLTLTQKLGVYFSRWWEFLTDEPREANTEGGVLPAIFGTFAMTVLLAIAVAPFGVITALYLREYARQGRLVSIIRISVNNLAGVPSIVYGVFGLGFFAYIVGGTIDQVFFAERLPNPTFGTGGLLWSSLTLALLTVPVVIVATEEALAAVPRSMREGSLACGASKWQTIRYIVLPRAMPGIMTGLILAMARGAGEVAPLMLVGVVKLAPELPIDGFFPFIHLERSFMHLGFHIYDVGFQSRNSEAGKPMVFVTTLLLVCLIAVMNMWAILVRNRLKQKYMGSQF
jgi:phosphate transport system permease protein